jgi:hypothetical protein
MLRLSRLRALVIHAHACVHEECVHTHPYRTGQQQQVEQKLQRVQELLQQHAQSWAAAARAAVTRGAAASAMLDDDEAQGGSEVPAGTDQHPPSAARQAPCGYRCLLLLLPMCTARCRVLRLHVLVSLECIRPLEPAALNTALVSCAATRTPWLRHGLVTWRASLVLRQLPYPYAS